MPIPDKIYSILGFINIWKLYHKYIILHHLSIWNVEWSSHHAGLIVSDTHVTYSEWFCPSGHVVDKWELYGSSVLRSNSVWFFDPKVGQLWP